MQSEEKSPLRPIADPEALPGTDAAAPSRPNAYPRALPGVVQSRSDAPQTLPGADANTTRVVETFISGLVEEVPVSESSASSKVSFSSVPKRKQYRVRKARYHPPPIFMGRPVITPGDIYPQPPLGGYPVPIGPNSDTTDCRCKPCCCCEAQMGAIVAGIICMAVGITFSVVLHKYVDTNDNDATKLGTEFPGLDKDGLKLVIIVLGSLDSLMNVGLSVAAILFNRILLALWLLWRLLFILFMIFGVGLLAHGWVVLVFLLYLYPCWVIGDLLVEHKRRLVGSQVVEPLVIV